MAEKPQRVALPRVVLSRPALELVSRDRRKSVSVVADVRRVDLLRPAAVSFDAARRDPVKDRVTCKERPDARVRSFSGAGGRKVDFIPWCS